MGDLVSLGKSAALRTSYDVSPGSRRVFGLLYVKVSVK